MQDPGSRPWWRVQPLIELLFPGPRRAGLAAARGEGAPPSAWALRSRFPSVEVATSSCRFEQPCRISRRNAQPGARKRGKPILPLQRPVLVVFHDPNGVTARDPSYLAASPCTRVAVSPRPPCCTDPLAVPGLHLFWPAFPSDLALQVPQGATRRSLLVLLLPILGFIEFQVLPLPVKHRMALPLESSLPFPRCTPAPRSLHSLPLRLLTRAAIPPLSPPRSPGFSILAACNSVHASARPSRRWISVTGSPVSLASTRLRHRGLPATRSPTQSGPRSRAASPRPDEWCVAAPFPVLLDLKVLPQTADRSVSCMSVRRRPCRMTPGVLPGLVLMRGRDRSPHPPVPQVHRRSPSGSHPGALVPVSRATHAWAASSPRGGRLQHLGGVASTH